MKGDVLFVHPKNDFTGSTRVLSEVIQRDYADRKCRVITVDAKGFLSQLENVEVIPVFSPEHHGRRERWRVMVYYLHSIWLLLVHGCRADCFYINTILPYYAAIVGRMLGKKLVYHIHEAYVVRPLGIRIAEFVFAHVKSYRIFVSEYLRSQYPPSASCTSEVRYNTLPPSFLEQVRVKPLVERGLDTIIMVSSMRVDKGIYTFLELSKRLPEYKFVLILSVPAERLADFADGKLPPNLKLLPAQQDVGDFLHDSDLLLNLTIPALCVESFGMTILEAMAYGVPSVVPNVGGPTEVVIDGVNGFCTDVTDVDNLAAHVRKALSPRLYPRLMEGALERVKHFEM